MLLIVQAHPKDDFILRVTDAVCGEPYDWNSNDSGVTRQVGIFPKGQNMFRQRSVVARKKDVDLHSQSWTIVSQFWESSPHPKQA